MLQSTQFAALVAVVVISITTSVTAAKVSGILVFGDVLSDAGWQETPTIKSYGLWFANNRTVPYNRNGFYNGRPQNGQGWSEFLVKRNKLNMVSYASTGCSTNPPSAHRWSVGEGAPTLREMMNTRNGNKTREADNEAVILQIGRHDLWDMFLQTNYSSPNAVHPNSMAYQNSVLEITRSAVEELAQDSLVKAVILGNIPPIDESPQGVFAASPNSPVRAQFAPFPAAITYLNSGFANITKDLKAKYPNVKIILWDIHSFYRKVAANITKYGMKVGNAAPCLVISTQAFTDRNATVSSICYNPQDYMFWTAPVPTVNFHRVLAKNIENLMRKNNLL